MQGALSNPEILGSSRGYFYARLIELYFLHGDPATEVARTRSALDAGPPVDLRYVFDVAPALAVSEHFRTRCDGECLKRLADLFPAEATGSKLAAVVGRVKIGALAFEHRGKRQQRQAWDALAAAAVAGFLAPVRWWARRYAVRADIALELTDGTQLLAQLMKLDAEGWTGPLIGLLPRLEGRIEHPYLAQSLGTPIEKQSEHLAASAELMSPRRVETEARASLTPVSKDPRRLEPSPRRLAGTIGQNRKAKSQGTARRTRSARSHDADEGHGHRPPLA